jgi:nucleoside-diphosphate-sugar epimerase
MRRIIVTGADGYLGSHIAARCLAAGLPVTAWVHASTPEEFSRRARRLAGRLRGDLACVGGDLTDAEPFGGVDPATIGGIVHTAGVTRFDVDQRKACRVNVAGTAAVVRFAERCAGLRSLVHLSSVYAAGLLSGPIAEAPVNPRRFANHYEWSKWRAEAVLREASATLPWRVLRVATVLADDDSGRCGQHNVLHDTLRLLYQGLLSILPGEARVPVYLVTADVVAEAALALLDDAPAGRFVHACPPVEDCPTLEELLRLANEAFQRCPDFRRRRPFVPPFCRRDAFELLVEGLRRHGGSLSDQVVGSLAPFAPQLYVDKALTARRLPRLIGRRLPDAATLLPRVCERLLADGSLGSRGKDTSDPPWNQEDIRHAG